MGHTFRKEKSFDDKRSHKKIMVKEVERKQVKNQRFSDYYNEEFEEDEFEDGYETDLDDSLDDEKKNNNFTKIKR
jgi:hypothetical protein